MFKRKKVLIALVVIVLVLATSITAYAQTSNVCTLSPSNTGEAKTAALSATITHYSGYNSTSSTDTMGIKLQTYESGEWIKVGGGTLKIGEYGRCNSIGSSATRSFRTKIWSSAGQGHVQGTGCVFDW